jgi:hypothetical protein
MPIQRQRHLPNYGGQFQYFPLLLRRFQWESHPSWRTQKCSPAQFGFCFVSIILFQSQIVIIMLKSRFKSYLVSYQESLGTPIGRLVCPRESRPPTQSNSILAMMLIAKGQMLIKFTINQSRVSSFASTCPT